jgi:hypothetical protein
MRKLARTDTDNFLVSRIWSEIVSGILANADLVVTRAYGLQLVGKRLDIETVFAANASSSEESKERC